MRRVKPEDVQKSKVIQISPQRVNGSLRPVVVTNMDQVQKALKKRQNSHQKIQMGAIFNIEHWRGDQLLREFQEENLCPDEFINYVLDAALSGATPITAWYVLIFSDNHTPGASDTYATPGFTESTDYDETTRPAWTEAGVSSKVITNSASKATFTMNGTDTSIYGAAIVGGGSTPSTKDDQAGGGTLGPEAQFTGGAVTGIVADDVLKVYVTITGSDV